MDATIGLDLMGRMQAKWLLRRTGDYKHDLDRTDEKVVNEEMEAKDRFDFVSNIQ